MIIEDVHLVLLAESGLGQRCSRHNATRQTLSHCGPPGNLLAPGDTQQVCPLRLKAHFSFARTRHFD
jgi:hypothetical protein